ncbi:DUF2075 domain-containing protein [Dermacoccus nishinomiyaensis]|uniref:DUF2075 domain-containing protein n=1 Tax=Dermacoccus nishinomiyaensis TaxID=1274 RepID=UPI001EF6F5BE|nr:DUF2075 domain-containing protein [Dermacoccus nishinomiyaensis]MCG7429087.1 DUF2075 domain-containing protein [Dermacoccus nishinomiyaensis]
MERRGSIRGNDTLVSIAAYGRSAHLHPGLQVAGYCDYLTDFSSYLATTPHHLSGAAYLHNATDAGVADLFVRAPDDISRVFTGQRRSDFVDFLSSQLAADQPGRDAADALVSSKIEPSKQLLTLAAEEVQQREQFVLLDEQRAAYEYVLHSVERARRAKTKTTVIISGGPGSGKSVIALSRMGELSRQGPTLMHATGSRSVPCRACAQARRRDRHQHTGFKRTCNTLDRASLTRRAAREPLARSRTSNALQHGTVIPVVVRTAA